MNDRIRLKPTNTYLVAMANKLDSGLANTDDDGPFQLHPIVAPFAEGVGLTPADVTYDGSHFGLISSTANLKYRDPLSLDYVTALESEAVAENWLKCVSFAAPLTVYGFGYHNPSNAELLLTHRLDAPITFTAAGQWARRPEINFSWGPQIFVS